MHKFILTSLKMWSSSFSTEEKKTNKHTVYVYQQMFVCAWNREIHNKNIPTLCWTQVLVYVPSYRYWENYSHIMCSVYLMRFHSSVFVYLLSQLIIYIRIRCFHTILTSSVIGNWDSTDVLTVQFTSAPACTNRWLRETRSYWMDNSPSYIPPLQTITILVIVC